MPRLEANLKEGTELTLVSPRTKRSRTCTVGRLIGEGGSAKVYSAILEDETHIVLKCQRWEGALDPAFELEISIFKSVTHRNIVLCIGIGVSRNGYVVMAFPRAYDNPILTLGKESIAETLRRDAKATYPPLPLDTCIDLGYELLRALRYLERKGFVHHDVKLANLMIDVGPKTKRLRGPDVFNLITQRKYRGVLIDLGATRTRQELDAWNSGRTNGILPPQITPVYAPPEAVVEQRRGDGTLVRIMDPSCDVYAAALVLYAMITGHPPYSHLETPPNTSDLESMISVKSAERRGDIEPVSAAVIRRVVFDEAKFVDGDRASFDLALHRFLLKRLSPVPADRGTAKEMTRDFEKLCYIDNTRGEGGVDLSASSLGLSAPDGTSLVYLPFSQSLVEVGERGEHPLLKAARLYGVTDRFRALPDEEPKEPKLAPKLEPRGPIKDKASGLVFVDDAASAMGDKVDPSAVVPPERRSDALTRPFPPRKAPAPRENNSERVPAAPPPKEPEAVTTAKPNAQLSNYRFDGSAAGLFVRYGLLMVTTILTVPAFGLAVLTSGVLGSGEGIGRLGELQAVLGDPAQWSAPWGGLAEQAISLPPVAVWIPWLLLVLVLLQLSSTIGLYRLRHTQVFGAPLSHEPSLGLGETLSNASLVIITVGLAAPWIALRKKRVAYRAFVTSSGAPLDFQGTGMQMAKLWLLSVVMLPLALVTLGFLALPLHFFWARWEQSNLVLPDAAGRQRVPVFTGSLGDYLKHAIPGWLLTVVTLGLFRPWAAVRTWRWLDSRTVV